MNELLSATVSQDDGISGVLGWITVREHKTGSTGTCKLAFSGNKVLDLLRYGKKYIKGIAQKLKIVR